MVGVTNPKLCGVGDAETHQEGAPSGSNWEPPYGQTDLQEWGLHIINFLPLHRNEVQHIVQVNKYFCKV